MRPRQPLPVLLLFGLVLALIAGCGGPKPAPATQAPAATNPPVQPTAAPIPTNTPAPTATSAPTAVPASPTPAPTAPPTAAPTTLQDVKKATVRIVASGSFREPQGTRVNSSSGGTGFIIDPSGLAVTNNHVVTGAAILKVYIAGEQEPRSARVLGVSECSDLALIQILGGGTFPALKWYEGDIEPGLEIYAAGFPLADPEYTLTRGIVSKARANGQTNWASVPTVLEDDAVINPGNSGGPLVTKDGQVVGINYAAASQTRQSFAIARVEAEKVIQVLKQGKDLDSLGINGEAFVSDDGSVSGIWIYSVKSGSPADKAGVKPGDILTELEGVTLATKGTMEEYCDILRSHDATSTLNAQVYRVDTDALLEGQINGRELKEVSTNAAPTQPPVQPQPGQSGGFVVVEDDSGALTVQIPEAWQDVDGQSWSFDKQTAGAQVSAAPDLTKWRDGYDTPGAFFGVSRSVAAQYTPDTLLDYESFKNDCTYQGRKSYDDQDNALSGVYDVYTECDNNPGQLIQIAATPKDNSYILLIQIISITDQDVKDLDSVTYKIDASKIPQPKNPSGSAAPPTATPAAAAPVIVATIQKYDYSQWGRPSAMDDPKNGKCADFNNARPVKKLTASLHVENHSKQTMQDWYGYFYKPNGDEALTCYQGYDQGFPDIAPGKSVDITFSVYVETNETVSYGVVHDSIVGNSARLKFP